MSSAVGKKRSKHRRDSSYDDSDSDDEKKTRRRNRRYSSDSDSDDARRKHSKSSKSKASRQKEREKERRRKEKEIIKSIETPEEKRARRLAKKEAKRRKQLEKFGWDRDDLDYTNTDNPFGDKALFDKFVWQKKRDKEAKELKLNEKELERVELKRREQMKLELEKVKQRRQEREKEKAQRDSEREMMQRMKESELFGKWSKEEDDFHLSQAKLRSMIRIESGRAKPIDLLAKYISCVENPDDMDIEMQEPYLLLRGLNHLDLEDLLVDISDLIEAEKGRNQDFWRDMHIVCEDELKKLHRLNPNHPEYESVDRRGGINKAVSGDVASLLKGKTHSQLVALQDQIQSKLSSSDVVDIGYWESLQQQLKALMARARLRDRHQAMLQKTLYQLKQEQLEQLDSMLQSSRQPPSDVESVEEEKPGPSGLQETGLPESESLLDEEDILQLAYEDYEKGCYSPKLLRFVDVEEELLVDPKDDASRLAEARRRVEMGGPLELTESRSEEDDKRELVQQRGEDGTMEEEYNFNSQVKLEAKSYAWQDKYKPRKPRFFNRVHTGYEWNKYNQTHYDHDNPPPKIVQGYKFNIFYPDLIDKRKTPEFFLDSCKDSADFAILRFHAGPPYEDIAFKIVNREWECSWKKGFKSQFSNNIFQLWFRFKRDRYRR